MIDNRSSIYNKLVTYISLVVVGMGTGWLTGLSVSPVVSILVTSITGAAAAIVATLSSTTNVINRVVLLPKEESNREPVSLYSDPLPLALLIIGLLIGSILGITARNQHWLGSEISSEIDQWSDFGLSEQEVARRIFEIKYPYTTFARNDSLLYPDLSAEITRWTTITNTSYLPSDEEITRRLLDYSYPQNTTSSTYSETISSRGSGTILFEVSHTECSSLLLAAERSDDALESALRSSTEKTLQALPDIVSETDVLREVVEKVLCDTGTVGS